jgi:hypothetical protein
VIDNKTVTCKKCDFAVTVTTKIVTEEPCETATEAIASGFASHTGWTALRDHVQKAHPEYSAKLSEWIYGTTEWKLPYEIVEKETKRAERQCGTQTEAA